jgi:DNA-3-methyladenine glycosylase
MRSPNPPASPRLVQERPGRTRTLKQVLDEGFYARPVLEVARDLIGCTVTHGETAGVIVETEAYHESEPACHAFVGLTPRTRVLFGPPGRAYVYRSYGIHALFNAVCEPEGVGAGVLIRALAPLSGVELMAARRGLAQGASPRAVSHSAQLELLCSGPGKLTQALDISLAQNGTSLSDGPVRIGPRAHGWEDPPVLDGTRIGISHAVDLRWRFSVADCRYVSRPWPSAAGSGGAAGR